jgi:hypothetical protein
MGVFKGCMASIVMFEKMVHCFILKTTTTHLVLLLLPLLVLVLVLLLLLGPAGTPSIALQPSRPFVL